MRVLCGYNVNIDALYRIEGKEISALIASENIDLLELINKIEEPPSTIKSISDFYAGLIRCMKLGAGSEWLIEDNNVLKYLKETFYNKSSIRMGGNAGIMTNVLSNLDIDEVIPNVVAPSETQLNLFSKKGVIIPKKVFREAVAQKFENIGDFKKNDHNELIHFVFDFNRNDEILIENLGFKVPRENRFIATYDPENTKLEIANSFELYAIRNIDEINGSVISGFHLLREKYQDNTTHIDKINNAVSQVRTWKIINNQLKVHAELGDFLTDEIALDVFKSLDKVADSIGMNEDELTFFNPIHNIDNDKIKSMSAFDILEAVTQLIHLSKYKKIVVHTRDFIISVFIGSYSKATIELQSLDFGSKVAALFAHNGKIVSRNLIDREIKNLQENKRGKNQIKFVSQKVKSKFFGRGIIGSKKNLGYAIIPTIITETPISTVGLGDTVTAATFLHFLENV
ncbi:ADP-dependent glucokinase/phosphofructokinase [Methanosalsum natronophilum]|nr:ADP-dependent glucokinase/phosphofructokinase [Methanosalsum natronophilum]MCS3924145.1 ADP-dependent phosphofructokinase/glucokinase [Methanosalsum natronophilum]